MDHLRKTGGALRALPDDLGAIRTDTIGKVPPGGTLGVFLASAAFKDLAAASIAEAMKTPLATPANTTTPATRSRSQRASGKGGTPASAASARGSTNDIASSGDTTVDVLNDVIRDLRATVADMRSEMAALRQELRQHWQQQQPAP